MRRLAASLVLVGSACAGLQSRRRGSAAAAARRLEADDEAAAEALEFPSTATRNTIRVGGGDAATEAAGVASALFPATGASDRPTAVALVDQDDWQSAVAAAVLAGPPIGAPLLLSDGDELPRDRGHARAARAHGLRSLRGCPGDPHRPRRRSPRRLQDGRGARQRPVRKSGGHRPLLLSRARPPVQQCGALLGRAARVGDARRVLGGALGRRRAPGQGRLDPRRRSPRRSRTTSGPTCTCSAPRR